jgi:Fe-S oxidoreductase
MCTYGEWPESYPLCPIYSHHRVFTASGGGLIYLARALLEKKIDCTSSMAEMAFQCTLCEACDMCQIIPVPKPHVTPSEIIRLLRNQLVKEGVVPDRLERTSKKTVPGSSVTMAGLPKSGTSGTKDVDKGRVLFVEVTRSETVSRIYGSALALLEKIGRPVAPMEARQSGCDLYDMGSWQELNALLQENSDEMKKLSGKEVLFLDPHSQAFLSRSYPDMVSGSTEIKTRHFSEFLLEALKENSLKIKKKKVTLSYHDPCRLSRSLEIQDAPRDLLRLMGAELKEMKRNRNNTFCCGAGGGIRPFQGFSDWTAKERLKEFQETGAELLITACPHCKEQFQRNLPLDEGDRVKDLTEFVQERVV